MNKIINVYEELSRRGFDQRCLKMALTEDPDDHDYKVFLTFTQTNKEVTLDLDVAHDFVFDEAEMEAFLIRAHKYMLETLKLYHTQATLH
jgi:hypothetical protein